MGKITYFSDLKRAEKNRVRNLLYFATTYFRFQNGAPLSPDQIVALLSIANNSGHLVTSGRCSGMSTLVALYAVWVQITSPLSKMFIVCPNVDSARTMIRMVDGIRDALPAYLRTTTGLVTCIGESEICRKTRGTTPTHLIWHDVGMGASRPRWALHDIKFMFSFPGIRVLLTASLGQCCDFVSGIIHGVEAGVSTFTHHHLPGDCRDGEA